MSQALIVILLFAIWLSFPGSADNLARLLWGLIKLAAWGALFLVCAYFAGWR